MLLPSDSLANARTRVISSERLHGARQAARRGLRASYPTQRPLLVDRAELPVLLNRRGLLGCGVEVGVKEGEFSELLLASWRGRHLVSVDPWLEDRPDGYVDIANVDQGTHDTFHERTLDRLRRFGERSTVWRLTSLAAAPRVLHHCLDLVYIDARHDYESVKEDLGAWYDKVRPGGIVAGHDYVDGSFPDGLFGVKSAVDDFFAALGVPVHHTLVDHPYRSWFAIVPSR